MGLSPSVPRNWKNAGLLTPKAGTCRALPAGLRCSHCGTKFSRREDIMRANRGLWLACACVLALGLAALRAVGGPADGMPKVPLGLPPLPVPADNPMTPEKIELGRMLYFDTRLSRDGTVSCATCHDPRRPGPNTSPRARGSAASPAPATRPP